MSIKIMSDVWAHGPEQAGELMVLLVLADYANDDGECWPAVTSVAQKARITDRSARRILRNLEEKGFIQTRENRGRNYTNLYQINLEALKPDNLSAPQENRTSETENRTFTTVKPDTVSPEPSLTIKEPSGNKDAREIREVLMTWAGADATDSFIAYRRKSKSPLTLTAARRISNTLNDILSKGGDPDDALGLAEERGWRGLQSDWYFKSRPTPSRPGNGVDPALEQISRLAGLE